MIWPRKFLAVLSLSAGAACLALPFPDHMEGERTTRVVVIEVNPAPLNRQIAAEIFGDRFLVLDYEGLNETPTLQDAVLGLMGRTGERCVNAADWRATFGGLAQVSEQRAAYAFRDEIWEVTNVEHRADEGEGEMVCFEATRLGAFDNADWNPMVHLAPARLEPYPEVKAELEYLAGAGRIPEQGGRSISPKQWQRFHHRELDRLEFRPSFVVLGKLFSGGVENEPAPWVLKTPWLRPAARVVGALAMFVGIFLTVASYRRGGKTPGIAVAPGWFRVFCDTMTLLLGLFCVTLFLDVLWVGPLAQPSLLGLHPEWPSEQPITGLHFVAIPGLFLALPLFSLFVTSISNQRIDVDSEGITSYGALLRVYMRWDQLERTEVREQRNPFAFTVVDFRKLQSVVDLEGDDIVITINEPGSRRRKAEILGALIRFAPENKQPLIRSLERGW